MGRIDTVDLYPISIMSSATMLIFDVPRIIYIFISAMGRVMARGNTTVRVFMKFQVRSYQIGDDGCLFSVIVCFCISYSQLSYLLEADRLAVPCGVSLKID